MQAIDHFDEWVSCDMNTWALGELEIDLGGWTLKSMEGKWIANSGEWMTMNEI